MKEQIKPYTSRGRRISKSHTHEDLWIIDIIGTNQFYSINMSTQLMLQNNPPDTPDQTAKGIWPTTSKPVTIVADFLGNEVTILSAHIGRMQSIKTNRSQLPKGLANTL